MTSGTCDFLCMAGFIVFNNVLFAVMQCANR